MHLPAFLALLLLADQPRLSVADFERDTGLSASAVSGLSARSGDSQYRIRSYQFLASAQELEKLERWGMHIADQHNGFDHAAQTMLWLAQAQRPVAPAPPAVANFWGLAQYLPSPKRTLVACYPQGAGFDFRIAEIVSNRDRQGLHEVRFGAGGELPADAVPGCSESNASFLMVMLMFYGGTKVLPYPFVERNFDMHISPELPSTDLYFHGTIFVDSEYYYRFELPRAQFEALLREKSMVADPGNPQLDGRADGTAHLQPPHLEWWLPAAQQSRVQWFQLCQAFGTQSSFIRATWHEGLVYWYTSGIDGPQPGAEECGLR